MKARVSILDIRAALSEINKYLVGQYVVNIYDIDNKTYLIKLRTAEDKKILLFESGMRVHLTEMEWPKANGKYLQIFRTNLKLCLFSTKF